jgi:hypothetical protein
MAELIPLEYRIRVARSALISRWATVLIVTVAILGVWVLQTYMWKRKQAAEYNRVAQLYNDKSVFLKQNAELRARRDDLAARMRKIEAIQGDKTLLTLLSSAAGGFSDKDSLEYIRVDAHPTEKKPENARYFVRLRGVTMNDTTHSQLLERLTEIGKSSPLPLVVPLGEKHVAPMFDGEVTFFDITCDQPVAKGG